MKNSYLMLLATALLALPAILPAASLWNESSQSRYTDTCAHKVGDLLTVVIAQESSASTQAVHKTDKGIDVNGRGGSGLLDVFPSLGMKSDRTTNGSGSAAASTRLLDRLTVVVTELLPNGNLKIEGTRTIKLEKDEMTLVFGGVIRQEDITPDNSISSILVADQRLEAKGNGPIAEKQRPGLISKLLNYLW